MTPQDLVLDTNVVLDLLVFQDPGAAALAAGLQQHSLRWLCTHAMQAELARVLTYPHVAKALSARQLSADQVLALAAHWQSVVDAAPPCGPRCEDPDDQMFIDLAVHRRATLLSKDRAVLAVRRSLAALGLSVQPQWAVFTNSPAP